MAKVIVDQGIKMLPPLVPVAPVSLQKVYSSSPLTVDVLDSDLVKRKVGIGVPDMAELLIDDSLFPTPPGWGAMTKKKRKKLMKIWHNKMRSGAQAIARGDPSSSKAGIH